jgi:hypothetical protein
MKKINILLSLLLSHQVFSFEPLIEKKSPHKIDKFKILGERCTGTNFVESLIKLNCLHIQDASHLEYGHKHFIWWLGSEISNAEIKKMGFNPKDFFFQNSENCLFVVVVRNPYDWIRSLYAQPHYIRNITAEELKTKIASKGVAKAHFSSKKYENFIQFLLAPYLHVPMYEEDFSFLDNYHPELKRTFKNILEVRKYKYLNYLKLYDFVNNYIFVRYEDVDSDPEGFLDYLKQAYQLELSSEVDNVDTYKGYNEIKYVPKTYPPFELSHLNYINQNLDWKLEGFFGYSQQKK